jgi:hypothetical protein
MLEVSERFILLGHGTHQVNVYDKRGSADQPLVTIPAGLSRIESRTDEGAQVAAVSFALEKDATVRRADDPDFSLPCSVRQFEMVGHTPNEDAYWLAVQSNVWAAGGDPTIER